MGASGFGKTNLLGLIQEHYLLTKRSYFFFDPKADIEAKNYFKDLCLTHGKEFLILDNSAESITINPVGEGTVNQITDKIMKAMEWSEVFYKDQCQFYLTKALIELEKADITPNLKNIYDTLKMSFNKPEITSLLTKLENILTSDFKNALIPSRGRREFKISEIREEGLNLYLGLSTLGYGDTSKMVGKLLLGDLLFHAFKTMEDEVTLSQFKEKPLGVMFDEFGSLATPNYIDLLNKCRGAAIELTMATQTLSDFAHLGSAFKNQVLENTSNLFILKQRTEESATYLSKTIGTVKSEKFTNMTEDGETLDKGSVREVYEFLCHADIIKNLGVGKCVFLSHDPLTLKLIQLRKIEIENQRSLKEEFSQIKETSSIYLAKEEDFE